MKRVIKKVAVLGSGIMGSRIACHFANIGVEVLLLDIVPKELNQKEKDKGLTLDKPAVRNRIVISTLLGRQRRIPEIHSSNRMRRAQGERLAINTVVQGSAADLIKVAMVRLYGRIKREKSRLHQLIQARELRRHKLHLKLVEAWRP